MSDDRVDLVKEQVATFIEARRVLLDCALRTNLGQGVTQDEMENARQAFSAMMGALVVFGEAVDELLAEVNSR